jgi:IS30 family transposase
MPARLSAVVVRGAVELLAAGMSPMEVARRTGVSKSKLYRLQHSMGGMYRISRTSHSARFIDHAERCEIARLRDAGLTVRQVATRLGRAPSTISRELRRNVQVRTGRYEPARADRLAWERQRRPKPSKLSRSPELRKVVQAMLAKRYSPDQVSGRLRLEHPDDPGMSISHETIYQSLYVHPRGELKRELQAHLRRGRVMRHRRGRTENRGGIRGAVSIHDRPDEVESRLVAGHHEGDLIKGSLASNSAVGTIVERTTGYLTLLHLPGGHSAVHVAEAVIQQMSGLPGWFAKTLTWDRGAEMTEHARISRTIDMDVFFADPYKPYQRGSNENMNGLLREYLPKGTDLSVHSSNDLAFIENEINDRPRKRLEYRTPREAFATLIVQRQSGVATTA